jgi:uncharacterized protein (DUF2236 family)
MLVSWRETMLRRFPAGTPSAVAIARSYVRGLVVNLLAGRRAERIEPSQEDAGWFAPDSVARRVHRDLPSMLVGGISALMLQSLHPLAMAGVYDHSNFRKDPLRRLRRTAAFIAGTTYGSAATAEALVDKVRRVHETVVGTAPDGRPYSATDPELLTWVHTAEVMSFVRAYVRYSGKPLSRQDQDRYFAEMATIAERLGAVDVPRTVRAVDDYFEMMKPRLEWGDQARQAIGFLLAVPAPERVLEPFAWFFFQAAIDLLPDWAKRKMGLRRLPLLDSTFVRPGLRASARLIRWATSERSSS